MVKKVSIAVLLSFSLLMGTSSTGIAAGKHSPEIRKYLKEAKKRRKLEGKKIRKRRRADPYKRIRPYQTLEEIYRELDRILAKHPKLFTGGVYGKSVKGKDLRWIKLSTGPGDKPEVLISANIHAQELGAGQMAMAILRHFADNYGKDCNVTRLADAVDIYFVPVMNPDGLAKTVRKQTKYGFTSFIRKNANKVDLNRNFPYPPDGPSKLKNSLL